MLGGGGEQKEEEEAADKRRREEELCLSFKTAKVSEFKEKVEVGEKLPAMDAKKQRTITNVFQHSLS